MSAVLALGVAAGLAHAAGFWLYARRILRGEVRPNGMSWLMRSYGTAVIILIWAGLALPTPLLVQPLASLACALAVAALVLRRGSWLRPARQDYWVLVADLALLGGCLVAMHGPWAGSAGTPEGLATVAFLAASLRKVAPYWPILRTTFLDPSGEHPDAWFAWAAGYGALLLAAASAGLGWAFLLFPAATLAIHVGLGWLALPRRARLRLVRP
jgi:hypothetical protein